jgi:uncharacterized membrane protein
MKPRRSAGPRAAVLLLALLGLIAAVILVLFKVSDAYVWGPVGAYEALLAVLVPLWPQLRGPAAARGRPQLAAAANALAARTLAFWLAEARVRGLDLHGPALARAGDPGGPG